MMSHNTWMAFHTSVHDHQEQGPCPKGMQWLPRALPQGHAMARCNSPRSVRRGGASGVREVLGVLLVLGKLDVLGMLGMLV